MESILFEKKRKNYRNLHNRFKFGKMRQNLKHLSCIVSGLKLIFALCFTACCSNSVHHFTLNMFENTNKQLT